MHPAMLYALIKQILLPPGSPLLIAAAGLLMVMLGRRRSGLVVISIGLALLYLLSMPVVATVLIRSLEAETAALPPGLLEPRSDAGAKSDRAIPGRPGAIVILSAGFDRHAPEYGGPTVDQIGLQRLRYGAWLHRSTGLPILVSGGQTPTMETPLAVTLAAVLREDFQVPVRWLEIQSRNTLENAVRSAAVLSEVPIGHVYLVTTAWHMPRAAASFRHAGLTVTAAPTGFTAPSIPVLTDFFPSAGALRDSYWALHERLGHVYYRRVYGVGGGAQVPSGDD